MEQTTGAGDAPAASADRALAGGPLAGGERELLLLAFRSSGKSTLVGLFCAWLLSQNPDLRILVLAGDFALAKKMVRNVKRIIERHPLTASLKPAHTDHWASDQFTVKRRAELRDPRCWRRASAPISPDCAPTS